MSQLVVKDSNGKKVDNIDIVTTKDKENVELFLHNEGDVAVRNIHINTPLGVRLKSPRTIPESIQPNQKSKIVLEIDTSVTRKLSLDIEFSFIKTSFT